MDVVNDVVEELRRIKVNCELFNCFHAVAVQPLLIDFCYRIDGTMQLELRPEELREFFFLIRWAELLELLVAAVDGPAVRLNLKWLNMKPEVEMLELVFGGSDFVLQFTAEAM